MIVGNDIRSKVFSVEAIMKSFPKIDLAEYERLKPDGYFQIEIKEKHHFSKGVYAREIFIPAGVTLVGEIHKFENLNILSEGEISVLTEEGIKRVKAPFTVVSPPGTKRIAYAHTNCVWTTIHGTDLKDINEIRQVFIAATEQEWLDFNDDRQLELKLCHG